MKAVANKDRQMATAAYQQAGLNMENARNAQVTRKILEAQLPEAEAQAELWRKLQRGELGQTAKGILQFAPILKMISGR